MYVISPSTCFSKLNDKKKERNINSTNRTVTQQVNGAYVLHLSDTFKHYHRQFNILLRSPGIIPSRSSEQVGIQISKGEEAKLPWASPVVVPVCEGLRT